MRFLGPILALLLVPSIASADAFDEAIAKHGEVGKNDLAAFLWAYDGSCADARDEADRIACREVAKSLVAQLQSKIFYLRIEQPVTAGRYDRKKKSTKLVVEACLVCDGVATGNDSLVVVGRTGKGTTPAPLRTTSLVFQTAEDFQAWEKQSLPRLVGEYLFRMPSALERVQVGGKKGAFVDVFSYRIFDRCSGDVTASKPKLGTVDVGNAPGCQ